MSLAVVAIFSANLQIGNSNFDDLINHFMQRADFLVIVLA